MYKVLVVDDEKNIRERLVSSIPWNEAGFRVTGAAADGLEALELMERDVPHVVMTDILMPEMNGIELAKSIQARYPRTKVLILSAYDDFKYAQDAIRFGVKGYLLKPLMKQELVALLHGLALELKKDEELYTERKTGALAQEETMLIDLVKGENAECYDEPWLYDNMRIIVCSFEKRFEKDLGLSIRHFITEISRQFWKESHIPILFYGNHLVLFAHDPRPISKYDLKNRLEQFSDCVKQSVMSGFGKECSLSIGIGNMVQGPEHINTSYNQAIYSCSYTFFDERLSIIFYQDLSAHYADESGRERTNEQLAEITDRLTQAVLSQHINETASVLRDFFDTLEQAKGLSLGEVRIVFSEIVLSLLLKAKEKGISLPALDKKQALEQIYAAQSLAVLKSWLKRTVDDLLRSAEEERDGNRYVILAKQHVLGRYSEKITLEDMARQLYIHPAYFSSIFKKETGQNFIDYVNEVRVRKAAELLRNKDCRIKDISAIVGFQNHSYFVKVFKKVIGRNPLGYRSNDN
ncbi:hypothetical protein SD70_03645 [Gordoniibacillus kamchatkensis]|uniref:DNA-binding response regulator n=1 Tax=Gordoniibacillus kamchatkensis TaxID=1590651 RepID=A0ABR5ALR9_9BACL|nr:response regulator [Paenibacillus sp. VKM B-2647]KIL41969.1 hypothetical protein SD70_03645 [Paenibacillus sp. VKM B-2647]